MHLTHICTLRTTNNCTSRTYTHTHTYTLEITDNCIHTLRTTQIIASHTHMHTKDHTDNILKIYLLFCLSTFTNIHSCSLTHTHLHTHIICTHIFFGHTHIQLLTHMWYTIIDTYVVYNYLFTLLTHPFSFHRAVCNRSAFTIFYFCSGDTGVFCRYRNI